MASPPFSIAETVPEDDDFASQFPGIERTYRDVVESWLLVNHNNLGQHSKVELEDRTNDTVTASTGVVVIWNNGGAIKSRTAAGTVTSFEHFPTGTKLLFPQAAPPTGWTLDVAVNDRVLRVSSSAGATIGGSWTISGVTVDEHILTVSQIPAHQHGLGGSSQTIGLAALSGNPATRPSTSADLTEAAGGSLGHDHGVSADATWRPAYMDVVVGIKA